MSEDTTINITLSINKDGGNHKVKDNSHLVHGPNCIEMFTRHMDNGAKMQATIFDGSTNEDASGKSLIQLQEVLNFEAGRTVSDST